MEKIRISEKRTSISQAIATSICMLLASSIFLISQDIESGREHRKSYIGAGILGVLPGANYDASNFGIDVSYRHKNKFVRFLSLNSINVNYLNYRYDDTTRRQNYSVTVGRMSLVFPNNDRGIFLCGGVDYGVLYKEKLYGCVSINFGFITKIYKNINFDMMLKTKFNTSDKFYTEGVLGLSYSF